MRQPATILALLLAAAAGTAMAQDESENRVAAKTDWAVFVDEDPEKLCWVVSAPKETENTRDGRIVAVRRGDILLMVSFWPDKKIFSELSFSGGYEFADGSTVTVQIGDATYELFTEGEWAWSPTPEDDKKVIVSLKRGSEAVVTGLSKRSKTVTKDTFSLLGFTAALEEAEARCSS